MTLQAALSALVFIVVIVSAGVWLGRLWQRERRTRRVLVKEQDAARDLLAQAWRLEDVERILRDDPEGTSIDPARDPVLHRIFLHRSGQIPLRQFIEAADREAALDRLAVDLTALRAYYERDRNGLAAAWHGRFGRRPDPEDLERLLARESGESTM